MEFTGKIIAILSPRGGVSKTSGNEWKSQEYVIENHDQYPRKMCFDVFGADKIEQFNIQMGEELTVSFDVDARQWNDRWFNSIRAWKVERVGAGAPMAPGAPVPPPAPLLRNLLRVMPRTICLSKPKVFRLTIQIKKLPVRMILAGSFFIPALCKDSAVG
jgi:hypothetical protein